MAAAYSGLNGATTMQSGAKTMKSVTHVGGYEAKPKSSLRAASSKDDVAARGKGGIQTKPKRPSSGGKATLKARFKERMAAKGQ